MAKASVVIIFTTLPSEDEASKLAIYLIENKLAACIQICPITSHYVWKNKVCQSAEWQLQIKTAKAKESAVFKAIQKCHPYSLPELLSISASTVSPEYRRWIGSTLKKSDSKRKGK